MDTTTSYLEAARAYADGVRVLFTPSGVPTGERGGRGPASWTDLADQAFGGGVLDKVRDLKGSQQ